MNYCKYHPIIPATYACRHCTVNLCDNCTDEGKHAEHSNCFTCAHEVESLGSVNQAEPFWNRFDKAFRYPLNTQSLIIIIVLSILTSVVTYIPFGFLVYIVLMGTLLKYSFSCLQETANGMMTAPDIIAAEGDGSSLLWKLFLISVSVVGSLSIASAYLGAAITTLLSGVLIITLPATLIIFVMNDSVLAAINPFNQIKLINSIGLPYALLLCIILIMFASVGVINETMGGNFSFLSRTLQSMASNYYTIVLFHIMGYMLFQYQGNLGFTAREDYGERKTARTEPVRILAKIKIMVKEGGYGKAVKLFSHAVKSHPNNDTLNSEFFKYLLATKNTEYINEYASIYLQFLEKNQQSYKLMMSYKRLLQENPNYKLKSPELSFTIAKACEENGDPQSVIQLIKDFHKDFPGYEKSITAYELLANTLNDLPNMSKQTKQCRDFISRLKEKQKTPEKKESVQNKAFLE
jgi:tetratricopeptide (TPR) repeat protein